MSIVVAEKTMIEEYGSTTEHIGIVGSTEDIVLDIRFSKAFRFLMQM